MRVFSSILSEILAFEVDTSNGTTSTKISRTKYSLKNAAIILQEIDNETFDWSKKRNAVAVLLITGSDVGTRVYDTTKNDATRKITENNDLVWTIHENHDNSRIDFLRRSSLENILNEIERKELYIANTTVSSHPDIDIYIILKELYEQEVNISFIKRSKEFRAFFFESLFDKIKLPVLLFFLALLFVNYIVFSNIKEKHDISETAYNIQLQKTRQETADHEKANRLFSEYTKIQTYPLALIADRVASYIPKDLLLTSMVFFPENRATTRGRSVDDTEDLIIVKGKAGIAGTILLFIQYLQEDELFSKVDIISINNLQDTDSYDFEIHAKL